MYKKNLLILFFFSFYSFFGQNDKLIAVDNFGNLYEINPSTCQFTQILGCNDIYSIAYYQNYIYYVDYSNSLYKVAYNTNNCTFLGQFNSSFGTYNALTINSNGILYAINYSNELDTYDINTGIFSNIGTLPSNITSAGDLMFINGDLILATTDNTLLKIDVNDLSNSSVFINHGVQYVFGVGSFSQICSDTKYFLTALNSSFSQTNVIALDIINNSVGSTICSLPFPVFDTASYTEGGLANLTIPAFSIPNSICINDTFTLPTTSNNNITGTWTPQLVNNQTTTTYTFTPTPNQCATSVSMIVNVTLKTIPAFTLVASICSGEIISPLPTTSTNGISGSWTPSLNNLQTTTYTFTPNLNQCATSVSMTINVLPNTIPTFTQATSICVGEILSPLPTTSTNGFYGNWTPSLNNLQTTTYTFTPTPNQCATSVSMTINVLPKTIPTFTQVATICSGTTLAVLPSTTNNGIVGSWLPALNNTQTTIYTFTPTNLCASSVSMTINVYEIENIVLPDKTICLKKNESIFLDSSLNTNDYTFQWYKNNILINGEINNDLYVANIGSYFVEVKNKITGCISKSNISKITEKQIFLDFSIETTDFFEENATITIKSSNSDGVLLYQLDNGYPQESNQYTNVVYGKHFIRIFDKEGCVDLLKSKCIVGFPKFFTPNGDSYNDIWNLINSDCIDIKTIYIFNRFGKLITNLNNNIGWNGLFNGADMPADDYWFRIVYIENGIEKEFKGHFSLVR